MLHIYLIFLIATIYSNDKSATEIQKEIDSRFSQVQLLKQEIKDLEEDIISKTKNEINISELLLDYEHKISLSERLINSMNRDEKIIQRQIDKSYIEIANKEDEISTIQSKLKNNMVYAYKNGKITFLESILNADILYDITYKTKYLKTINTFQHQNKKKIKQTISDLKIDNQRLQNKLRKKRKLKEDKKEEIQKLQNDIVKKNILLNKINIDKKNNESKLANKQKSLEEIETIINKLYSDKKNQEKRERELAEIRKLQQMAVNGNFKSMKGKLPWPIDGKIVAKFGNKKN